MRSGRRGDLWPDRDRELIVRQSRLIDDPDAQASLCADVSIMAYPCRVKQVIVAKCRGMWEMILIGKCRALLTDGSDVGEKAKWIEPQGDRRSENHAMRQQSRFPSHSPHSFHLEERFHPTTSRSAFQVKKVKASEASRPV